MHDAVLDPPDPAAATVERGTEHASPHPAAVPRERVAHAVTGVLEAQLALDQAIDGALCVIVDDTERSAVEIMKQVRLLHDTASKLVEYLNGSGLPAGDLRGQIQSSMRRLGQVGDFIEHLPANMERDLQAVRSLTQVMEELYAMNADVQQIGIQSHILSINAAVEACHAGPAGAPFAIVAEEMRRLAADSRAVAGRIASGLTRARDVIEGSIASSLAESSRKLGEISDVANAVGKVRGNFEDLSDFYKTRLEVVTQHNEELAREIAEVLGQIQYQDVVRQTVERVRAAMNQRNESYRGVVETHRELGLGPFEKQLAGVPRQLELVLQEYVANEASHFHSARSAQEGNAPPVIELF